MRSARRNAALAIVGRLTLALLPAVGWPGFAGTNAPAQRCIATFSIVACDTATGEVGVAVESRFLAVGSVVPWAQGGVGAVATQAWGNTTYGPRGLELLARGLPPKRVVKALVDDDQDRARRQVGIVDARGRTAAHTGQDALPYAGHLLGEGFSVQGNSLSGPEVLQAMVNAYRAASGTLAERMLAALNAGQQAGGDQRGQQSAALLVVRRAGGYAGLNDRYIDLRVDDHPEPITELTRLFALHERTAQAAAHLRFGAALKAAKRAAAAQREFALALRIAQKYSADDELTNQVAWNLAIQEEFLPEALRLMERAIREHRRQADYWDTIAEIHARMGQFEQATTAESLAVQLAPERPAFQKRLEGWRGQVRPPSP